MRALILTLFIFCGAFALSFKAEASHINGSEISYKCTGTPGVFEVTLILYSRCGGTPSPICSGGCGTACSMLISISGADAGCTNSSFGTSPLQLQNVRDVDVKSTCPGYKSVCTNRGCVTGGTSSTGFEQYEFKGTVNLGPTSGIPASCCNIRLSYSLCCRSGNINTGAADAALYTEAVLNRCLSTSPCNSSPVFKNDPKITLCGGENYIGNWGAIDPDLDSLSYSFAPALSDQGVPVTYNPPFAYDKPMPWTGNATGLIPQGIHCDPLNGDIMFTPPNGGSSFTGILCIAVKQWRKINGVPTLIGTTMRDVETTIAGLCGPNNPPRFITSPPEDLNVNVPRTNWTVCAGEQLCFTITAKDTDHNASTVSDTTYLHWDSALVRLGATFLPHYDVAKRHLPDSLGGGPREDRYRLCWTPADSLARSTPYYFTISAADKRCPNPGELTRGFSILVMPKASAQIIQTAGTCQKTLLSYVNVTPSVNITGAVWRIAKTPNDSLFTNGFNSFAASTTPTPFLFKNAGRFFIQLDLTSAGPIGSTGCFKTYTDYIDATGISVKDSIETTDLTCSLIPSGKIVLKGYNGTAPYQYKLNNQSYSFNNTFTNLIAGKYIAWVKDSNGCETADTVWLNQPVPLSTIITNSSPVCHNDSNGSITIHTTGGIPPYTFQINQKGFQSDSIFPGLVSGPYQIMVRDANACFKTDSVAVQNPARLSAIYTSQKPLCVNDSNGSITINSVTGKQPFKYAINNGALQSSNIFTGLPSHPFLITITDSNHCMVSDSVTIPKTARISANYTIKQTNCFGGNDGEIRIAPLSGKVPFTYSLNNQPFQSAHLYTGLQASFYLVTLKDSNNCTHIDSVIVTQPTVLSYVKNKTEITCFNANDGSISLTPGGGTAPYQVLFDSVLHPVPATLSSIKPGHYRYQLIDSKNCQLELMDSFENPLQIIVGSISGDTTVLLNSTHTYSISFQQNLSFAWAVSGGSLLSSSINPPSATVRWDSAGTGMIGVVGYNSLSCGDTSSLQVTIGSVGLTELTTSWGLNVYPNPVKNILNISLQKLPEQTQILLFDVQGKLVLQQELKLSQQLNIEALAPGIYVLKIGAWSGQVVKE